MHFIITNLMNLIITNLIINLDGINEIIIHLIHLKMCLWGTC
jgi:hypothetical protein